MDTSYLSQQVTTIIERLHGFFDEIGVPSHERDSRESELFSALSETLHNQLNTVAKEKHDLTERAQDLIKTIRQLERSLDDSQPKDDFEAERDGLKVTFPLLTCIQKLKEKHHTISKLHRERFEEVKKLAEALDSYASHLEPSFLKVKLPPLGQNAQVTPAFDLSATYFEKLDNELNRVYQEYNKRVATVSQCAADIVNLWSELGTPQAQIDSHIVQHAREAPEQLGLHQDDLRKLGAKRDKLINEKQQRERKLKELRATVESLWDRLGVDESERKQFLAANRGCGLRQINEFEDELSRLNELKRQNLHIFVEDARFKLQELWDSLYFSEEEMMLFTPAFSDVYSDALLSAHEQEIARLEALKEQRAPILAAVEKHRSLIQDREDLEKSSQDASRLMSKGAKGERRDPGKLLREEKMRKRITKELPKVESELRKTLEAWENEYGRPFCVHGERYLDELAPTSAKAVPPRSKTPVAPHREPPKSTGKAAPSATRGRAGTTAAPPPRSKTPTATIGRREMVGVGMANPTMSASTRGNGTTKIVSPSKIPGFSRLPMSTLRDGNNSPERRAAALARSQTATGYYNESSSQSMRSNLNPPRAPPPKMKELFIPPTPTPMGNKENGHDLDTGSAIVRHVSPDDPYRDDNTNRYGSLHSASSSASAYPRSTPSQDSFNPSRPISRQDYPMAPPSRQASNTSSVMSGGALSTAASSSAVGGGGGVSGSENWESYTDNSETEDADATEAYYAKVKAQQMRLAHSSSLSSSASASSLASSAFSTTGSSSKRPATALSSTSAAKRMRDHQHTIVEEATIVEGRDEGWMDEGEVGEAY